MKTVKKNLGRLLVLMVLLVCAHSLAAQEELEKRVEELEEIVNWLKVIGIPLGSVTVIGIIYFAYQQLWGFEKKIKASITEQSGPILIKSAPDIVEKALQNNAVFRKLMELEALKTKKIVVLSKTDKIVRFKEFLVKKGFSNLAWLDLSQTDKISGEKPELIFINNEEGDFTKAETTELAENFGKKTAFFYFNKTNQKWEGPLPEKISFANSLETIEPRLLEILA